VLRDRTTLQRAPRRANGQGFILTLTLILVISVVVIGSFVFLVRVRNHLFIKSGENVIYHDTMATPIAFGRAKTFDLCEAPLLVCKDPDNGLVPIVGVRPDRFTSRNQAFYASADCDPAGGVFLAPPAVPPALAGVWPPELPVGYLNGSLLVDGTPARIAYGVGAPAGFSFATQSPTGPGLLYRSTGAAAAAQAVASVWTSLAPDCAPRSSSGLLEVGRVIVGATPVVVSLRNEYVSPVVVATVQYANNTAPVVTRVSGVTSTSFAVRLQSPVLVPAVVPDTVHYLVVEAGSWIIDGFAIDAQTYLSTVTDRSTSWVGEAQAYGQAFTDPVVIGQVMSENDPDWSVFWARGVDALSPPSAATLFTGKHVGQDTDIVRADETVGFVVFEAGHGILAGYELEAALGPDTVQSSLEAPPYAYTFGAVFGTAPTTIVASQAAMDGVDGSWAQLFGVPAASRTMLSLSVEEDQITDVDGHTTEQVAYAAFAPFGLCTNLVLQNYTLVPAVEVEITAGTNVLEQYTPPFAILPALIEFSEAAAEDAGLQAPTIFTPGSPTVFPDAGPEDDPALPEDAPGAVGPGDDVTQPDAGAEDDPPAP
jgi:hypothetical protein